MNFASDNTAGIAPEILQALAAGNDGFAMGYGNDDVTRAVERWIGEIFERDAAVFLVPTGTAANALALAHVSPPWGAVFAHTEAHILTDECEPGRGHLEGGRRCAVLRRHQGRRYGCGGGGVLRPRACRQHGGTPEARRASRVQASLPGAAVRGVSQGRLLAAVGAPRQCDGRSARRRTHCCRALAGLAGRGQPGVLGRAESCGSSAPGRRRTLLCAPE